MTAISLGPELTYGMPVPPQSPQGGRFYEHVSFTEESNPELAFNAQLLHADGFYAMGFVDKDALTQEGMTDGMIQAGWLGRLVPELDHARGEGIDYHVVTNPDDPNDSATLRKYNLLPGQTYQDLPAYALSKHALTPSGLAMVQNVENPQATLKEIGALARGKNAHPLAGHAVIRSAIHEALGKNEFWFSTLVAPTHDSLVKSFGSANLEVLGENVTIPDDRVKGGLALKPMVLRPDNFVDNLAEAYVNAKTPQEQNRLQRSLLFFTEGLTPDDMSSNARQIRQEILMTRVVQK